MKPAMWKPVVALGSLLVLAGCAGYGNESPEPMGYAVEEMRAQQTYDPYASQNPPPMALDGKKAEQVMNTFYGTAQSAPSVKGDIQINIGK